MVYDKKNHPQRTEKHKKIENCLLQKKIPRMIEKIIRRNGCDL